MVLIKGIDSVVIGGNNKSSCLDVYASMTFWQRFRWAFTGGI